VTFAEGQRFAIDISLDEDDFDDCAQEEWPGDYTI
jgi:hypothetical protein